MKLASTVLSILLTPLMSFSQESLPLVKCQDSASPLFQTSEVLEMTLKGNFPVASTLDSIEMKYRDSLTNLEKSIHAKASKRGKSRSAVCEFKPIRITWEQSQKSAMQESVFKGIKGKEIKLTTHCRYLSGSIEKHQDESEIILKEYLIYRILKSFGLPTFDVRLAKIQYTTPSDRALVEGMGFFMESNSQFEKRCGLLHAKKDEVATLTKSSLNQKIYVPYLFARLISNARDFVDDVGHNSELFYNAEKVPRALVPYDFNDSGQVNSGVVPYWSFTPHMLYWFDLLRQGPFTREGRLLFKFTPAEQLEWKSSVIEMAKFLIEKREAVLREIENSPLQEASKNEFREYIGKHLKQFQRIIDDHATPDPEMKRPVGVSFDLKLPTILIGRRFLNLKQS